MATLRTAGLVMLALLGAASARALEPASAGGQFRVSVNEANGPPFVLYDGQGRFQGGLARDIMGHLAERLNLQPVYLNLPRARVEPWLRAGKIDAACFLSPGWVADASKLRWSPTLFHIRQVIVSPPGATAVSGPDVLAGKRLGTLLNYRYPELEPYFSTRRILRADAPSLASNIAKLRRGRVDAFLNDDIASLYAVKQGDLPASARIDPLWAPENPVYCAFSPRFSPGSDQWKRILRAAVYQGRVRRWIAGYTDGRRVASAPPGKDR